MKYSTAIKKANTLKCALELFGTRKIELPDTDFEYSTIQEILQRVAIPSFAHEKVESDVSAEATLRAVDLEFLVLAMCHVTLYM